MGRAGPAALLTLAGHIASSIRTGQHALTGLAGPALRQIRSRRTGDFKDNRRGLGARRRAANVHDPIEPGEGLDLTRSLRAVGQ